jgi:DDE superfamily endonuclease
MAKRKRSNRSPQPKHSSKKNSSQYDRVSRLRKCNPTRRKTLLARIPLVGGFAVLVTDLAQLLDKRIQFRFLILVAGMLLSRGRQTASSWFRAAGVRDDWDQFYDLLIHLGRKSTRVSWSLLLILFRKLNLANQSVIRIAIDDSPTKRYGKKVEGAGVHHNPTAGPADGEWMYGHNWVSLGLLQTHKAWGVIAFPIRSMLYVRGKDVPTLTKYNWEFQTKHQLAVELVTWFVESIRGWLSPNTTIQLIMDGAYVSRDLFQSIMCLGVTIISRLRKDSILFDLPEPRMPGQRGRTAKYGKNRISLAKRAGSHGGWNTTTYRVRKQMVTRQYKSFLATSRIAGGVIRVVIVRYEDRSWAAFFSTNPELEVGEILEAVADRWSLEECFHDLKEVWGSGEQQVRNVWSSIGCWNVISWVHSLVMIATWEREDKDIVDRSDRSWDNPARRPSISDKIQIICKEMIVEQINVVLPKRPDLAKIRKKATDFILSLAS